MPFLLVPLIGLVGLVAAIAAGAAKKNKEEQAGDIVGPGGTQTEPTPSTPIIPNFPTAPVPNIDPAKVAELVKSAIASGQVNTMREAAAVLRQGGYPLQAAQLEALAEQIASKAVPSVIPGMPTLPTLPTLPTTVTPATPSLPTIPTPATPATPAPSVPIVLPGIQNAPSAAPGTDPLIAAAIEAARAAARAVGDELTVQDISDIIHGKIPTFPRPKPGTPQVILPQVILPTNQAGKDRAGKLALGLKFSKKGTASEPKTLVKDFQVAETILPADGLYGSAVAIMLADKYGIVPPQAPYYWGKKNDYNSIAPDKANYRAVLLRHAASEPQRADEWKNAAAQVK